MGKTSFNFFVYNLNHMKCPFKAQISSKIDKIVYISYFAFASIRITKKPTPPIFLEFSLEILLVALGLNSTANFPSRFYIFDFCLIFDNWTNVIYHDIWLYHGIFHIIYFLVKNISLPIFPHKNLSCPFFPS